MKMPWLIWIPRVIIIAFALFTIVFSFDVFGGTEPFWKQMVGFLFHNIFFFVLAIVLVATWNRPMIAGVLLILFAIVMTVLFQSRWQWNAFLMIAGTPVLVGALFIIVHFKEHRDVRR